MKAAGWYLTCLHCGAQFHRSPAIVRAGAKFCSHACRISHGLPAALMERNARLVEMATAPEGTTLGELGAAFGITPQAVFHTLKKAGVAHNRRALKRKGTFPHGEQHHNWKGDDVSESAGRKRSIRVLPELGMCDECGQKPAKHRHHVDENFKHNDPSNLRQLCVSCHHRAHGKMPPRPDPKVISERMRGRIPWNKGLTKATAPNLRGGRHAAI